MKEEMLEEIIEYAEGIEKEEIEELIEDMEQRWRIRKIDWEVIEEVVEEFRQIA